MAVQRTVSRWVPRYHLEIGTKEGLDYQYPPTDLGSYPNLHLHGGCICQFIFLAGHRFAPLFLPPSTVKLEVHNRLCTQDLFSNLNCASVLFNYFFICVPLSCFPRSLFRPIFIHSFSDLEAVRPAEQCKYRLKRKRRNQTIKFNAESEITAWNLCFLLFH